MPPSSSTSGSASSSAAARSSSVPRSSGRGASARSSASHSSRRQVAPLAAQRRQPGADAARGLRRAGRAHRVRPGQRLVQHERERVQVGALVDALSGRLLGRHVREGADDVAGAGERLVARQVGDAEVEQLGRRAGRLGRDDHVLRLDVAVDDAAVVRVVERVGETEADPQDVAVAERAVALERRQRAAADQLGDQEPLAAGLAGVEHRHDPRVVEPRRRQRLALGTLGHRARSRDDLDRHEPVESFVARREDRAEPAGAQPLAEPVAPQDERSVNDGRKLLRGVHPEALRRRQPRPSPRCRRACWYYWCLTCPSSTRTTSPAGPRRGRDADGPRAAAASPPIRRR